MSTSPTEPDISTLDLNELRQLLKDPSARLRTQADHITELEKDKSDAELNVLAQSTHSFSPSAANLSASLNAAAPMDAQQVTTLLSQMETRLMGIIQQNSTHSTPQSPNGSSLSAASSGLQVSTVPPGVFFTSWTSTLKWTFSFSIRWWSQQLHFGGYCAREYDKAVEVDQRKLRNSELTPIALRKWKFAYNIYASDPHKRMKMSYAFGEESLRCLGLMFSDDPVPLDDAGFDAYLNNKFLKSSNLFSDIKTAVSKSKSLATPLSGGITSGISLWFLQSIDTIIA